MNNISKEYIFGLLWMLISPVFALITAFRGSNRDLKRWMLIIFTTIFGSIILLHTADGYDIWQNVYTHYMGLSFSQFLQETKAIATFHQIPGIKSDLFTHFLSYFLGEVVHLPGLFVVTYAFIYGYAFAGSMFRLFEVFPKFSRDKVYFGLAIVFIIFLNIASMSTLRTWTGFWILFYACISYYKTGKNRYLWLMFVPPLFHFGFFVIALPAWVVAFVGNRKITYAVIFGLSFFTLLVSPQIVVKHINKTELGRYETNAYRIQQQGTVSGTLNKYRKAPFYKKYQKVGVQFWLTVLIAFTFIGFGMYFKSFTPLESSLFSTGLLTKALANSTWFLYALSNRCNIVAAIFILAAVLLYIQRYYVSGKYPPMPKIQYVILGIAIVLFVPFILYRTSYFIYYSSSYILFFPFIPWIDPSFNFNIHKLIVGIIQFI